MNIFRIEKDLLLSDRWPVQPELSCSFFSVAEWLADERQQGFDILSAI